MFKSMIGAMAAVAIAAMPWRRRLRRRTRRRRCRLPRASARARRRPRTASSAAGAILAVLVVAGVVAASRSARARITRRRAPKARADTKGRCAIRAALFMPVRPAHFVIGRLQRGDQPVEMVAVARLAFDVGDQALGRQRGEHALVIDFDDVDALFVEDARDVEQRAGLILQLDAQPRQPPRPREIAQQHVGEQPRVDIAAAQHDRRRSCPRTARDDRAAPRAPPRPRPRPPIFSIWSSRLTACSRLRSLTSTMSSTSSRTIAEVIAPGSLTAIPSASVSPAHGYWVPLMRLYIDGNSSASTPITSIGWSAALARPPPSR